MAVSHTVAISVVYLASGAAIFLLGLTILRVGQGSAPTRATALMLFFAGIGPLLSATGIILEITIKEGSVVYRNMVQNFEYLWEFYFPSLMLFALSFPRESRLLRRVPFVGFLLFFPYLFHLAVMMFGDRMLDFVTHLYKVFPADKEFTLGSREVAVGGIDNVLTAFVKLLEKVHRNLFSIVNMVYAFTALYLLSRNLGRILNPRLTSQLRTVVIGLFVSVLSYSVTKFFSWSDPRLIPHDVGLAMVNFSLVMSGGTIAFAVIKQQFLGIRHVTRRAVLYGAVSFMVALIYLVVVRPVSDFFGQYSGAGKDAFETGFVILAIIAFQPALNRIEEIIELLVLKDRSTTTQRFKNLAGAVAGVTTLEELENVLRRGFDEILDTSGFALRLVTEGESAGRLVSVLEEIGEPVQIKDLSELEPVGEKTEKRRISKRKFRPGTKSKLSVLDEVLEEAPGIDEFDALVPVVKDRKCVGYICLGEKIYGVPYHSEELAHLSVLAAQIGSSLQNIRLLEENVERKLFEEELKIARKIQTQLLPGDPPFLSGFQLCALTVPSRYVGGDYYDFVVVEDSWLVIVVADVSGKGIPASILAATLQAAVRSNADSQADPCRMVSRLNRLLYQNTSAAEFATLFYCAVSLEDGKLKYTNAGHDFPYLINGSGVEPLGESGIVLGCVEDFPYEESACYIPQDGTLVIYTDGVTESESGPGDYFGEGRLQALLEKNAGGSAREICQAIIDGARSFGGGETQDDITVVVLKRTAD